MRRLAGSNAWLVDEVVVAVECRESLVELAPDRAVGIRRRGSSPVVVVDGRVPLLAAAELVAADGAAIVLADQAPRRRSRRAGILLVVARDGLPDELVHHGRPAAGRAAGREQLADRNLQARLLAGRRGDRLEGRVEMADVGRPKDDLGEQAGERVGLDRDRSTLPVHGRTGDPAAAAMEIDHHVAGAGVLVDRGRDQVRWRRSRQTLEGG